MISDAATGGGLGAVAGLVLLGSVVPVVPTGAVVAAGAAYARSDGWDALALALVVATLAALAGDAITFALLRSGAGRLAKRWTAKHGGEALEHLTTKLAERGPMLLTISRLIPAGRLPVLLAAGLADLSWRRMLPAQAVGCALWAVLYGAVGLAGGGVFGSPLADALAAVVLALAVNGVQVLVSRRRRVAT